jgi:hypothetical protein
MGEPWVYPETSARICLFLVHPCVRSDLELAYSKFVRDPDGAMWVAGNRLDRLCLPAYGFGDDRRALEPSEFSPLDALLEADEDPWFTHGPAAWLEVHDDPSPPHLDPDDGDPTPAGWDLADLWALEHKDRRELEGGDDWVDLEVVADNDVPFDWAPPDTELRTRTVFSGRRDRLEVLTYDLHPGAFPAEATSPKVARVVKTGNRLDRGRDEEVCDRAWVYGLRLIAELDRIGGAAERPMGDYRRRLAERQTRFDAGDACEAERPVEWYDRLDAAKAEAKRLLAVKDEAGTYRWHPLVPARLAEAVSAAVRQAQERLDALYVEETRAEQAERDKAAEALKPAEPVEAAPPKATPPKRKQRKSLATTAA